MLSGIRLDKYDSVTDTMTANNIDTLLDRRKNIDTKFLRKIELGDYNIRLNEHIIYNHQDFNTWGETINSHYNTTQFQNFYFNRMRTQVKVFFPSDVAGCVNSQIGHRWAPISPLSRVGLGSTFFISKN